MAQEMNVTFLGRIPIDPLIVEASDSGNPFVYHYSKTQVAQAFVKAVEPLLNLEKENKTDQIVVKEQNMQQKRIAIPVTQGVLSSHFGHCEVFALYDVDSETKKILSKETLTPPPHEPGVLPGWLKDKGADIIIAGGMGSRAQGLFEENGIEVVVGAPVMDPEQVIEMYIGGTLETQGNLCDH